MSTEQDLYNGDRAREVLENEAYIAAYDAINTEITEQWKTSPIRDQDAREKLFLMQKMLQKIRSSLEATMTSGTLARAELSHRQSLLDKAKALAGYN